MLCQDESTASGDILMRCGSFAHETKVPPQLRKIAEFSQRMSISAENNCELPRKHLTLLEVNNIPIGCRNHVKHCLPLRKPHRLVSGTLVYKMFQLIRYLVLQEVCG